MLCLLLLLALAATAPDEGPESGAVPTTWRPWAGSILLGGADPEPEFFGTFLVLAGEAEARVILLGPTAKPDSRFLDTSPLAFAGSWRAIGSAEIPWKTATALLLLGPIDEAPPEVRRRVREKAIEILGRGKTVAAAEGAAAWICDGPGEHARLLPDGEIAPLADAAAPSDGRFHISLAPRATALVRGRRLEVLAGTLRLTWAAGVDRPQRQEDLEVGDRADWIAAGRAARWRSRKTFSPIATREPRLESGALVIVGGGLTGEIAQAMIERSSQEGLARIAILPTALGEPLASQYGSKEPFESLGAEVRILQATGPDDPRFESVLNGIRWAHGVWITGGRQWRLVDAYAGTEVEEALHAVLERGGVIGGSSAGASIQAQYLVRGNPLGNREMMSEGYERGFGFLPGTAVDQHFSERRRFADLASVKKRFPGLLGLGIDERTAAIVEGSRMTVLGEGQIFLFDRREEEESPQARHLRSGSVYDLVQRQVLAEPPRREDK